MSLKQSATGFGALHVAPDQIPFKDSMKDPSLTLARHSQNCCFGIGRIPIRGQRGIRLKNKTRSPIFVPTDIKINLATLTRLKTEVRHIQVSITPDTTRRTATNKDA